MLTATALNLSGNSSSASAGVAKATRPTKSPRTSDAIVNSEIEFEIPERIVTPFETSIVISTWKRLYAWTLALTVRASSDSVLRAEFRPRE